MHRLTTIDENAGGVVHAEYTGYNTDIHEISEISKKIQVIVHNNVISVTEICNYQGYPYFVLKCCNIVWITIFYNIFLQY